MTGKRFSTGKHSYRQRWLGNSRKNAPWRQCQNTRWSDQGPSAPHCTRTELRLVYAEVPAARPWRATPHERGRFVSSNRLDYAERCGGPRGLYGSQGVAARFGGQYCAAARSEKWTTTTDPGLEALSCAWDRKEQIQQFRWSCPGHDDRQETSGVFFAASACLLQRKQPLQMFEQSACGTACSK